MRRFAHRHDVVDLHALPVGSAHGLKGARQHFLRVADDNVDLGHGTKPTRIDLRGTARDNDADGGILAPRREAEEAHPEELILAALNA